MDRIFYISFFVINLFFAEHLFAQQKIIATYQMMKKTKIEEQFTEYRLFADLNKSKYEASRERKFLVEIPGGGIEEVSHVFPEDQLMRQFHINDYNSNVIDEYSSINNDIRVHTIDKVPSLNWEIGSESKEIGGYTCIKAEASFRGRDYIAWFAPSIGVPAGPWKFYGLPGLIMEVEDKEGVFAWRLLTLEEPQKDISEELKSPRKLDYKNIPLKDFYSLQTRLLEQHDEVHEARVKSIGAKVIIGKGVGRSDSVLEKYEWLVE